MRSWSCAALFVAVGLGMAACGEDVVDMGDDIPPDAAWSGGAATVFDDSIDAYSHPVPNMTPTRLAQHLEGSRQFHAIFVTGEAETHGGLGPLFNAVSCAACHPRAGRASDPLTDKPFESLLIRLSLPAAASDTTEAPIPVPDFGTQLGDQATDGAEPEAHLTIAYNEVTVYLNDGSEVILREPDITIEAYKPLPKVAETSARMPRPVFGLGLLEVVPEAEILSRVDEFDDDGDGVSGRANYVDDVVTGKRVIGRFGWKANQPNLRQQAAGAFNADMGITSSVFPIESARGQTQDDGADDDPEISDAILDAVTFYTQTLAVPARRNLDDPQVQRGERLFHEAGCVKCHVPTLVTGHQPDVPELSNQTIHPYTDMLLHDLGHGLTDGRTDFIAYGAEWQTPPLWGIGLSETVNGHGAFLHDGRARTILEAIMWHDEEAYAPREYVKGLDVGDREALVAFVYSL